MRKDNSGKQKKGIICGVKGRAVKILLAFLCICLFGNHFPLYMKAEKFPATSIDELEERLLFAETGENIEIGATIDVADYSVLEGNGAVLVREKGFSGPMFHIRESGQLIIGSLTLDGEKAQLCESLILNEGSLEIDSGTVLRNNNSEDGGGIYSTGRLVLNGGLFTGNHSDFHGGAIWSSGYLEMNDGEIRGNRAEGNGGGIYCDYGNFMLRGGNISDNDALCGGYDLYSQYRVLYMPGVISPRRCYGDMEAYTGTDSLAADSQDNGQMWFEAHPSNTSFIVGGYGADGHTYSVTYADYGFEAFLKTGDMEMELIQGAQGEERKLLDRLSVSQNLNFSPDGSTVQVRYRIRNDSPYSLDYSLGVGADVQAGNSEEAVLFRNYYGVMMAKSQEQGSGTKNGTAAEDSQPEEDREVSSISIDGDEKCFQIWCRHMDNLPDADACWLGNLDDGTYYHNLFADSPEGSTLTNTDTLLAFSWQNRILEPGEEETLGFEMRFVTLKELWKDHMDNLLRGDIHKITDE